MIARREFVVEESLPPPAQASVLELTYVSRENGRWRRRQMPEWFLQALFPEQHAQRRADVAARVYEKLEPWGA